MLFCDPKYKTNYLKYEDINASKTRNFYIKCGLLENINEVIKVFNENTEYFKLNSNVFVEIVLTTFFKEFETMTDDEKLNFIRTELIQNLE